MNKTQHKRQLLTMFLLLMLVFPLCAQEKSDSVFSFRFFSGKNMFYVPFIDNGTELSRLFDCVDRYKDMIKNHDAAVYVNGYCNSQPTVAKNLALAKIRSNRVKSELITRKGLTENCFVTRNHSGEGNFVTVNIFVPKDSVSRHEPEPTPQSEIKNEKVEEINGFDIDQPADVPTQPETSPEPPVEEKMEKQRVEKVDSRFALKTNLLDYAILMPNLEVEWKFADRWSVALEAQGAWWAKENPHKVYRLATLIPEVRFWPIERSRWNGLYVGIFGGTGLYDLCDGKKGHEGEGGMGGVSVGYMWPISKHLSLDAGIGAGYMHARDKEYLPIDGHYLYQLTKNINYFGPLRLKLSLVWRIPYEQNQSKK